MASSSLILMACSTAKRSVCSGVGVEVAVFINATVAELLSGSTLWQLRPYEGVTEFEASETKEALGGSIVSTLKV